MALFHRRNNVQETFGLILRAKTHYPFDASAIVPTAIENHDFSRGRKVLQISLNVHLRLFALRRSGHGNNAKNAWADSLCDGLDNTAFAGAIASLEDNTDLLAVALHPFLELDKLNVQLAQLLFIFFSLQRRSAGFSALWIFLATGFIFCLRITVASQVNSRY